MKFVDAITTPDVDQNCGQGDKDDKDFEAGSKFRVFPDIPGPNGEIAGQNGEDE